MMPLLLHVRALATCLPPDFLLPVVLPLFLFSSATDPVSFPEFLAVPPTYLSLLLPDVHAF
jgi:hypothetical protein